MQRVTTLHHAKDHRVDDVGGYYTGTNVEAALQEVPSGWIEVSNAWAYASASTITVPSDATTRYQIGDRLRFKQGGGYKYYTISAVAATLITVDVNTDYTVANSAITDIGYSREAVPFGFPAYFNWSPTATGYTVGSGTRLARFFRTGKTIDFWFSFTLAADSSVSGDFTIPLPVAPTIDFKGHADLTDSGSAGYVGFCVSGVGNLYVRAVNVAGTYPTNSTTLSATVPFTWATNDNIRVSGRYLG